MSIKLQDVDLLKQEVAVIVGEHLHAVHSNPAALSIAGDAHLKQTETQT